MAGRSLTLALLHEVFGDDGEARLRARLDEAREAGAALAVLPELPLDPWVPAGRQTRDEDAEEPGGPRHRLLSRVARGAGIGILGGAITRDPVSGRRCNRALLFDAGGRLGAAYDKLHIPSEEGFWESTHYEAGRKPPARIDVLAVPLGIQLCSDLHRPQGTHLLAAQGAVAVLAPRATPQSSYGRWKTVIRANAITAAVYVVSVNRPEPAPLVGGPSLAVDPEGRVLVESRARLTLTTVEVAAAERARGRHPGYLPQRADLYARAWAELARAARPSSDA